MEEMQTALLLGRQSTGGTAHNKLESILFASIKTITFAVSTYNHARRDGLKRERIIILRPVNRKQVSHFYFSSSFIESSISFLP